MGLKQWCVLSVLACALSSAGMTSAAELSVNGHIRSGGACGIALDNGGVVDLGNLSRKDIPETWLEWASMYAYMPWTINCQHPTKVGVDVIDNRAGTLPPGTIETRFGLGNPEIVGYYFIHAPVSLVDGRSVNSIWRRKGDNNWKDEYGVMAPGDTMSWGVQGQTEPVAFKTLKGKLKFQFAFRGGIAFTNELEIDGSATLELRYL
ncbi:DUF1120 domain-containing protein [Burkholderia sp. BE17]|uniref:DUF1120 domain-containing protein n=1 Tax=Burkholderia sp. BE17 TaxID=2656644 RepID=UPI00187B69EE|nr:DUF1120 domain-containing protein [Burkholderia sp. BE17]